MHADELVHALGLWEYTPNFYHYSIPNLLKSLHNVQFYYFYASDSIIILHFTIKLLNTIPFSCIIFSPNH